MEEKERSTRWESEAPGEPYKIPREWGTLGVYVFGGPAVPVGTITFPPRGPAIDPASGAPTPTAAQYTLTKRAGVGGVWIQGTF